MSWSVSDIQDKSGTIVFFVEGCTSLFDFSDTTAVDKVAEVGRVAEATSLFDFSDTTGEGVTEVAGDAEVEEDAKVEAEVAIEAEGVAKDDVRFNTP